MHPSKVPVCPAASDSCSCQCAQATRLECWLLATAPTMQGGCNPHSKTMSQAIHHFQHQLPASSSFEQKIKVITDDHIDMDICCARASQGLPGSIEVAYPPPIRTIFATPAFCSSTRNCKPTHHNNHKHICTKDDWEIMWHLAPYLAHSLFFQASRFVVLVDMISNT